MSPDAGPRARAVAVRRRASTRNTGVDALRLVSVAAVVLGHAYLTDLTFSRYLEVWRMPLFFFLTGYFWTRGRDLAADALGRARSLMVPYAVWAVLMTAALLVWWSHGAYDDAEARAMLAAGWYGGADQPPPWWAFWFISVLFAVTVLRRALERLPSWVAWSVAGGGLLLSHLIPESGLARTPLGVGLALPCLLFVLCGEAFRRRVQPLLRRHRTALGAALVALGLLAVHAGVEPHNIKFGGFGTPVLTPLVGIAMASGMVLVFGSTVERLLRGIARSTGTGEAIRRTITALTRTGTVVVLLHGWVLMEVTRLGVTDNLAKFVLALGGSWAVGLALLSTPLSRVFTGVPQPWLRLDGRPWRLPPVPSLRSTP